MTAVDRKAVVRRHTVEMSGIDPRSPLSVGNGELCLTVDVTGLQTFEDVVGKLKKRGVDLMLCEANPRVEAKLSSPHQGRSSKPEKNIGRGIYVVAGMIAARDSTRTAFARNR